MAILVIWPIDINDSNFAPALPSLREPPLFPFLRSFSSAPRARRDPTTLRPNPEKKPKEPKKKLKIKNYNEKKPDKL